MPMSDAVHYSIGPTHYRGPDLTWVPAPPGYAMWRCPIAMTAFKPGDGRAAAVPMSGAVRYSIGPTLCRGPDLTWVPVHPGCAMWRYPIATTAFKSGRRKSPDLPGTGLDLGANAPRLRDVACAPSLRLRSSPVTEERLLCR